MSKKKRMFWLVTALFVTGGCSSYRAVSLPGVVTESDLVTDESARVKAGDRVRLTLIDDRELAGVIEAVSAGMIVLATSYLDEVAGERTGARGENLTNVQIAEVRTIEVESTDLEKSFLVLGGAVAVAAIIVTSSIDMDIKMSGSTVPSLPKWTGR